MLEACNFLTQLQSPRVLTPIHLEVIFRTIRVLLCSVRRIQKDILLLFPQCDILRFKGVYFGELIRLSFLPSGRSAEEMLPGSSRDGEAFRVWVVEHHLRHLHTFGDVSLVEVRDQGPASHFPRELARG